MAVKKTQAAPSFTRGQLMSCGEFRGQRDILAAVLKEDGAYTKSQARRLVSDFLKGKVN